MKEYTVIKIECEQGMKGLDIYNTVKESVKFNSNFFEFSDLFQHGRESTKSRAEFEKLGLDKYFHIKVLEHLRKSQYYDPERDDRKLYSNLDFRWDWDNKKETASLDNEYFEKLISFGDRLKRFDVHSLMYGIDEIEWDGQKPARGTYGYEKAKSADYFGMNYLSDCVIIGRNYESKRYTVYLSCETRLRGLETVEKLISSLGKIKYERQYYAPESSAERTEWDNAYNEAAIKFKAPTDSMEDFFDTLPHQDLSRYLMINRYETSINVRKYQKQYLCTDGWKLEKCLPYEPYPFVSKEKGDTTVSIMIVPNHKGHYLQTLITYSSKRFDFCSNINYIYELLDDDDARKYFENLKLIRDYAYGML
ncbi:MAG: hypothetical protein ACI3YE_03425 [Candidatus Avispirillum sp.]